jgi:hypothetical protein
LRLDLGFTCYLTTALTRRGPTVGGIRGNETLLARTGCKARRKQPSGAQLARGGARAIEIFPRLARKAGGGPRNRRVESLVAGKASKILVSDAAACEADGDIETILPVCRQAVTLAICGRVTGLAYLILAFEITSEDATRVVCGVRRVQFNARVVAN